jgi:hypothetical protein
MVLKEAAILRPGLPASNGLSNFGWRRRSLIFNV